MEKFKSVLIFLFISLFPFVAWMLYVAISTGFRIDDIVYGIGWGIALLGMTGVAPVWFFAVSAFYLFRKYGKS